MDSNSPLKAYTYMFDDDKFWHKYLTLFFATIVIMAITHLCLHETGGNEKLAVMHPMNIPLWFIYTSLLGYFYSCIAALNSQEQQFILPNFSAIKNFFFGFKSYIANIIFIPFWLFCGFFLFRLSSLNIVVTICVTVITLILCPLLLPAFKRRFAVENKITAYYHFADIFKSINYDKKHYLKYVINIFLFMLCIGIVNVLITIPLVMQPPSTLTLCLHRIIVSIISSYSFMVFAYLFAKSINGPEDIEETSQW